MTSLSLNKVQEVLAQRSSCHPGSHRGIQYKIGCMVDNESSANFMCMMTYQRMRMDPKRPQPFESSLESFSRGRVYPKGRRLHIHRGRGEVKFPTPNGTREVSEGQSLTKERYNVVLASKKNHPWMKEEESEKTVEECKPAKEIFHLELVESDLLKVRKIKGKF